MANETTLSPITGREVEHANNRPLAALVEFYRAFNTRALALMEENWLVDGDIAMSNPLGGIKRGWNDIGAVYAKIFGGPAEVYVEYYDYTTIETAEMFFTAGRERGYFLRDGQQIDLAIRTSRIYQLNRGRWRQVHHHGSIDDPALLQRYQTAVLGG